MNKPKTIKKICHDVEFEFPFTVKKVKETNIDDYWTQDMPLGSHVTIVGYSTKESNKHIFSSACGVRIIDTQSWSLVNEED
jgi:hypothetical protein